MHDPEPLLGEVGGRYEHLELEVEIPKGVRRLTLSSTLYPETGYHHMVAKVARPTRRPVSDRPRPPE